MNNEAYESDYFEVGGEMVQEENAGWFHFCCVFIVSFCTWYQ